MQENDMFTRMFTKINTVINIVSKNQYIKFILFIFTITGCSFISKNISMLLFGSVGICHELFFWTFHLGFTFIIFQYFYKWFTR